jgi:hypothetical protein
MCVNPELHRQPMFLSVTHITAVVFMKRDK